jgi:hypothetical protein
MSDQVTTQPSPAPDAAISAEPRINVFSPDGSAQNAPESMVQHLISHGYRVASPTEVQNVQDEDRYGSGVGNALKAAAAGAARGSTFGLSDQFLTGALGVDPHTLQALKTHQAFASAAGEVAGVAGSALLAPELSPVGMLGKAGQAVAEGVAPAVQGITGSQIAAQTLSRAAGAALEGAGFGAGQGISEKALGDADLNAQKFLAHVGFGAMFGGALGGALGLGSELAPKVIGASQKVLDQFQEKLEPYLQDASKSQGGGFLEGAAAIGLGSHHPLLGAAYEAAAMLNNPNLAFQRLAKLNSMAQTVTDKVAMLSDKIFDPAAKVTEEFAGYLGAKVPFDTLSKKVSQYDNNPDLLMNHLNKATQELYDVAPDHAGALQTAAAKGVQFLNSKVPRAVDQKPLSPKYVPSQAEMQDFKQYFDLVNNPLISLEQVKTGMITPKAVEVLSNVYPKLYQSMQTEVGSKLIDHLSQKKLLPYKTKLALSLFLNTDLDSSMTGQSIMSSQMAHQVMALKNQAQNGGGIKTSQKGLQSLKSGQQILTSQQASSQRADT